MKQVRISLIICTRDRAASLRRCLAAVARSDIAHTEAELVVVDNGSRDETACIVDDFVSSAPFPVQPIREPQPGLSRARNRGLAVARGEICAFTDDDCYIANDYFSVCIQAFSTARFAYCGGKILLFDPGDARYGFNDKNRFELIPAGSAFRAGQIQGANMVFRREVIDRVGVFDPCLGAGTPFRCEDIDYAARASQAGFVGAHVPELVVHHHHGRKEGVEIEAIKRLDDIARGAYYVRRLREGQLSYLKLWLKIARRSGNGQRFIYEVRGAAQYLGSAVFSHSNLNHSEP